MNQTDLIYKDECYRIIGACFAVYKDKGAGFVEPIYQECLEIEFEFQRLPAVAQPPLSLTYRGRTLRHKYTPDFICFDKIVVEIKGVHYVQEDSPHEIGEWLHSFVRGL